MGAHGSCVDINILISSLKKLKRLITDNQVAAYKALSTSTVADLAAVNAYLQASDDFNDLDDAPTLDDPILTPPV